MSLSWELSIWNKLSFGGSGSEICEYHKHWTLPLCLSVITAIPSTVISFFLPTLFKMLLRDSFHCIYPLCLRQYISSCIPSRGWGLERIAICEVSFKFVLSSSIKLVKFSVFSHCLLFSNNFHFLCLLFISFYRNWHFSIQDNANSSFGWLLSKHSVLLRKGCFFPQNSHL